MSKKHVIYRNNVDYPYKAIIVDFKDVDGTNIGSGKLMYFDSKSKKYKVAIDNKCDITTGGIYGGIMEEN